MPLDVDRLAEAMLEGTQALLAKALAPLRAENEGLRSLADSLQARVIVLEGRPVPALVTERALSDAEIMEIKTAWETHRGEIAIRADEAIAAAKAVQDALVATKADVDRLRDAIAAPVETPDISGLATKAEVEAVARAVEAIPAPIEIPPAPDLSVLVTKDEWRQLWAEAEATIPVPANPPDLSGFATKDDVAEVRAAIPTLPDAPDLTGLATKAEVEAVRVAIPVDPDLSGFATKDDVEMIRAAIPEIPAALDLSGFATKAEVDAVRAVDFDGIVAAYVDRAVAAIPPAERGKDADPEQIRAAVAVAVDAAMAVLPAPERDKDADQAAIVRDVLAAMPTKDDLRGKDGAGFVEARNNDDGELILKLATGETFNVGKVRGADGLGFDDMMVEYDGERTIALVFANGDRVERKEIVLPIPIYRGVWKEGETYKRGDTVTYGGNVSIAQVDTGVKPESTDEWRLMMRKARDGKPGVIPSPRPETVKRS